MNKKNVIVSLFIVGILLMGIGILTFVFLNHSSNNSNEDAGNNSYQEKFKQGLERIKISDAMSSYTMTYILTGFYEGEIHTDYVQIQNYMNKRYKIMKNTFKSDKLTENTYYVLDDVSYIEEDGKLLKKGVSYSDAEIYLKGVVNAEEISFFGKDMVLPDDENGENEYDKYTFKIKESVMEDIMKVADVRDIEFKNEVDGAVWFDKEGYIRKIEYNLASGLGSETSFAAILYFSRYNETSITEIPEIG